MGQLTSSANTKAGRFSGSSYTNYKIFKKRIEEWQNQKDIEYVKVTGGGLRVEAKWKNGDMRWMDYMPHPGELVEVLL